MSSGSRTSQPGPGIDLRLSACFDLPVSQTFAGAPSGAATQRFLNPKNRFLTGAALPDGTASSPLRSLRDVKGRRAALMGSPAWHSRWYGRYQGIKKSPCQSKPESICSGELIWGCAVREWLGVD